MNISNMVIELEEYKTRFVHVSRYWKCSGLAKQIV
jgi:hypothetical protein